MILFHFVRGIKCFRKWVNVFSTKCGNNICSHRAVHCTPTALQEWGASDIELSVKHIRNEFPVYYLSMRLNAFVLYWKKKKTHDCKRCRAKPPLSHAFIYFWLSPLFWFLPSMFVHWNFSFHQRVREMAHGTTINGSHMTKLKDT